MNFIGLVAIAALFTTLLIAIGGVALAGLLGIRSAPEIGFALAGLFGTITIGAGLATVAWFIIIYIKAVMILNSFGAAKSIGILALCIMITLVVLLVLVTLGVVTLNA